jgi:hypothetical protein
MDFGPVVQSSRGPIGCEEFEDWHTATLLSLGEVEPRLQGKIGWAAKIMNVYLKTCAYVGDQGRPNLRSCLHPPIDEGLWSGVANRLREYPQIIEDTHCVTRINDIDSVDIYKRIIRGLRAAAVVLGCSLFEVEQLWEGARIRGDA